VCLSTVEVRVPNAQETCNNWDVLLQRRGSEMHIHSMCSLQERVEVLESNVDGYTETNGRPDTVSASNPALEAEHVLGIDTELGDFLLVGRKCNEVLGNISLSICLF
jgi:hypothetical protein